MLIPGPFILNGRDFSQESLLQLASEKIRTPVTPGWEIELYKFITDLFNEERTLVQQTSGTTSEPKSTALRRDAMLVSAQRTLDHFRLKPGDSALLCLPVQYIAGKMMVVRALLGGLNLLTAEPSGNLVDALVRVWEKELGEEDRIDFAAMVPLQVFELLKKSEMFSRIGKLIIGGGEIDPAMHKKLRTVQGAEIYETFAMSETYTHFATRRLNGFGSKEQTGEVKDSAESVMIAFVETLESSFHVMQGIQMELDDRGCLVVEIPGVTEGPVTTNDLVELTGPRSFRWLGRLDNVIKTGGIKVIPEKIEAVVKEIAGQEAVILPVPDARLGQRLLLVLEGKVPSSLSTKSNGDSNGIKGVNNSMDLLMNQLRQHLEKHEIPKEVRYLPEFPRNRSMKIDRQEIRRLLGMY